MINTLTVASAIGSSKENVSVFRRGMAGFESLDPDEQMQFTFLVSMLIAETGAAFVDGQPGIASGEDLESRTSAVRALRKTPGGRECWRRFGGNSTPELGRYVRIDI